MARPLMASSGMLPPGMLASETGCTRPAVLASRNTGCWLTLLGVV